MTLAIVGEEKDTIRYVTFFSHLFTIRVTKDISNLTGCGGLLLPGGGDIHPSYWGEENIACKNINLTLDEIQFRAFDFALSRGLPILGICKGMQLINVALGGTLTQHLTTAALHRYTDADQYHNTHLKKRSLLNKYLGDEAVVNSAHHQAVNKIGSPLLPIQWCQSDSCVEAIAHTSLPVLGLQWHPERLLPQKTTISEVALWELFSSFFQTV